MTNDKSILKSFGGFAVLALMVAIPTSRARADFSQDFEVGTSGWFPLASDTVNQEADGYVSPVPYASGVTSASPTHHARLRRPTDMCDIDTSGSIGPSVVCGGPFTRWGGYNSIWNPYTTQVDVYLDVDYARANPDSIVGNFCLTTDSSDLTCKGTRFDYSSAINDSSGNFLQDYAFDFGTGNPSLSSPCDPNGGWVVVASTNLYRSGTNIYDPGNDPFCIAASGWYTLKHTFMDVGGSLQVLMEIFPAGSAVPLHQWTITPGHLISEVGCNRYGWFANQEIWDLPIDNSVMIGCGAPATTTTATTSSTTSTTETTTTSTTSATSSTTTTTLCAPSEPAETHCSDMMDNDCDNKVDCVDEDCNRITPCRPARKDPTQIIFNRSGGFDRIRGHATLDTAPVDIKARTVGALLSRDPTLVPGVVWSAALPGNTLTASASARIFKYRDPYARNLGGFYSLKIKQRTDGTAYSFSFTAYADLSAATDRRMRLQFYLGDDVFITSTLPWAQTSNGWRAPKDH